jgi:hypothetical protein
MSTPPITASATPITPEEKKDVLRSPGLTSMLRPEAPKALNISPTLKQNFALAAEHIFVHALNRTVWIYRDSYQAVDLILSTIRNTAMESIATQPGIDQITKLVFGDEVVREFMFTLQAQFFSQFAEFHQHWRDMIGDIATALTGSPAGIEIDEQLNLVPEEISGRMFTQKHMQSLLLANNWLIMYILVALWGRTYSHDELRAIQRRSAVNALALAQGGITTA